MKNRVKGVLRRISAIAIGALICSAGQKCFADDYPMNVDVTWNLPSTWCCGAVEFVAFVPTKVGDEIVTVIVNSGGVDTYCSRFDPPIHALLNTWGGITAMWRPEGTLEYKPCIQSMVDATHLNATILTDAGSTATIAFDKPSIDADGKSVARASLIGNCFFCAVTWSLQGSEREKLGCTIDNGNITAGNLSGKVRVRATDSCDPLRYAESELTIVGCESCSKCQDFGDSLENRSVDFKIFLGGVDYGSPAGFLHLKAPDPSAGLADPSSLTFESGAASPIRFPASGTIQQIKTDSALAEIHVISAADPKKYTVKLYKAGDVSGTTAPYVTTSGTEFATWTVENPELGNVNKLRITANRNGHDTVTDYEFRLNLNGWKMSQPSLDRTETRTRIEFPATPTSLATATETYVIANLAGTPKFTSSTTYTTFDWGKEVTSETTGSGANAITVTTEFYSNPSTDGGGYRHVKQVTRSQGAWEKYYYDSAGRKTRIVTQFLDNPLPPIGQADQENQNRVTTIVYQAGSPQETYTTTLQSPAFVVSQHTRSLWTDPNGDKYVTEGSGNVLTTTWTFPATAAANLRYQVHKILSPNGTMELFTNWVAGGRKTSVYLQGVPNTAKTDIVDGTKRVTIVDQAGNLISEETFDIAVPTRKLSSKVAGNPDAFGRPQLFTYLDGTTETIDYACCGVSTFVDREGIASAFGYDDLKRPTTTARAGITTIKTYDAAGRVIQTDRSSGSSTIRLNLSGYDDAGRLTSSEDAVNNVTQFSEVPEAGTGHWIRTTILPTQGTRIETYAQDGSLLTVRGTAAYPLNYEYGADANGEYVKEIKVRGASSDEWVMHYRDTAGRPYKDVYPTVGGVAAYSQSVYDPVTGQLTKTRDPDGVISINQYDSKGQLYRSAVVLRTGQTLSGAQIDTTADRITEFETHVDVHSPNIVVTKKTTKVWETTTGSVALTALVEELSADGRDSWSTSYGQPTHTRTDYDRPNQKRQIVVTLPDLSTRTEIYISGKLQSVTEKNANGDQLTQTTFGYDGHGRLHTSTDARNGATTYTYYDDDRVHTVTSPAPGPGIPPQVTTYAYDDTNTGGRIETVTLPDNASVVTEYYLTGEVKRNYGARTYPVRYTYEHGRMKTLETWRTFDGGNGTPVATTWTYSAERGFLSAKTYADNKGTTYDYFPSGRLHTRTWQRGVVTTYTYNPGGQLSTIHYTGTGALPDTTYTYNRRGQLKTVNDASGAHQLDYLDNGLLSFERHLNGNPAGVLDGLAVEYNYDTLLRRQHLKLNRGSTTLVQQDYAYFPGTSRLQTVADGVDSATYAYLQNSPHAESVAFNHNGFTALTTTKHFDFLNRVTSILPSPAIGQSFEYSYNQANQRTVTTLSDNSFWGYQYDGLGQISSAKRKWSDNSYVAGQQYEFTFDDIGNRVQARNGGNSVGQNLRDSSYTPNDLNQYSDRVVPGYLRFFGTASSEATVSATGPIGGDSVRAERKGPFFSLEVPVENGNVPVTGVSTIRGVIFDPTQNADVERFETRSVNLPASPEAFSYDDDGNLMADGSWTYEWDPENRLSAMQRGNEIRLTFVYDYAGRRVQKSVFTLPSMAEVSRKTFVYNGWNLVAELQGNLSVVKSYTWGIDLSGSEQDAGGVGGLVIVKHFGSSASVNFVTTDGNGNVASLVDATTGTAVADYEFSPFGELIRGSGPMAKENCLLHATKYLDWETGLYYYGARYYNPAVGRWLSRDLFNDESAYVSNSNDLENRFDPDGNQSWMPLDFNRPPPWTFPKAPSMGSTRRNISDSSGKPIAWVSTDLINCIGYACNAGGSLHPTSGASLADMFKSLGYAYTEGIAAQNCQAHCGSGCKDYAEIYIYIKINSGFDPDKVREFYRSIDILNSPWRDVIYVNFPGSAQPAVDYHGLRGMPDGTYTYVPHRMLKGTEQVERYPSDSDKWPDLFQPLQLLKKFCLCKSKK